jgi:hypothetical protein
MAPTSTKLIHQGDRNRVANKERSDIFHFIGAAPVMKSLDWHSYNSFCVLLSLKRFKLISLLSWQFYYLFLCLHKEV